MTQTDVDLEIAAHLLAETIGCSHSTAIDIVDSIARYATRKSHGSLPAGWGLRGDGR